MASRSNRSITPVDDSSDEPSQKALADTARSMAQSRVRPEDRILYESDLPTSSSPAPSFSAPSSETVSSVNEPPTLILPNDLTKDQYKAIAEECAEELTKENQGRYQMLLHGAGSIRLSHTNSRIKELQNLKEEAELGHFWLEDKEKKQAELAEEKKAEEQKAEEQKAEEQKDEEQKDEGQKGEENHDEVEEDEGDEDVGDEDEGDEDEGEEDGGDEVRAQQTDPNKDMRVIVEEIRKLSFCWEIICVALGSMQSDGLKASMVCLRFISVDPFRGLSTGFEPIIVDRMVEFQRITVAR
ncbi:hypothetical protein K440DRAFT_638982 [Wilcoxina mikolae CBS 423.85]|nr:hypothetical protein K440DRAFT_638982 [Wilcoxina mikolae CBS 423.85]